MTWSRFKTHLYHHAELGVSLDISRIPFPDDFLAAMEPRMQDAFAAMKHLEAGAMPTPTSSTWSATTGSAPRTSRPPPTSSPPKRRSANANSESKSYAPQN